MANILLYSNKLVQFLRLSWKRSSIARRTSISATTASSIPRAALVAYANLGLYGNFAGFSQLPGIHNNDGSMHLLVVEITS